MNCLDRIHQLSTELRNAQEAFVQSAARNAQLSDENALLRSQLHDGQEQAKRDSETIARLVATKNEALGAINRLLHADNCICENLGGKADQAMYHVAAIDFAESFLSSHA